MFICALRKTKWMAAYTGRAVSKEISIRIGHNHQVNIHLTKDTGHRGVVFLKLCGNLQSQKVQNVKKLKHLKVYIIVHKIKINK